MGIRGIQLFDAPPYRQRLDLLLEYLFLKSLLLGLLERTRAGGGSVKARSVLCPTAPPCCTS